MDPDGSEEKILLGEADLNEALTLADLDINMNWEIYKERYFRRIKRLQEKNYSEKISSFLQNSNSIYLSILK